MQIIILVVSIILNIILLILLFFKSALNDILKEWWLDRRKNERENKERLIELRVRLSSLDSLSPLLLVQMAVHSYEKDPNIKEKVKFQLDNITGKWGQENEYISKNEILFPNDIRILLKEYHEKTGKAIMDVIKYPDKETLSKLYQEIHSHLLKIIDKVDVYLVTTKR